MNDTRKCTKCQQTHPLSMFNKHKQCRDGINTVCKPCLSEYRKRHKERIQEYNKQYWNENAEKLKKDNNARYYDNIDQRLEYGKNYYNTHSDERSDYSRRDRELNADKHKRWRDQYRANNPGKVNANNARRRKNIKRATPKWASLKLIEEQYVLAASKTAELNVPYEVDHIVPINSDVVCGLHCEHNLRVIPKKDNMKKRNVLCEDLVCNKAE